MVRFFDRRLLASMEKLLYVVMTFLSVAGARNPPRV
jgi:hypothetical protein